MSSVSVAENTDLTAISRSIESEDLCLQDNVFDALRTKLSSLHYVEPVDSDKISALEVIQAITNRKDLQTFPELADHIQQNILVTLTKKTDTPHSTIEEYSRHIRGVVSGQEASHQEKIELLDVLDRAKALYAAADEIRVIRTRQTDPINNNGRPLQIHVTRINSQTAGIGLTTDGTISFNDRMSDFNTTKARLNAIGSIAQVSNKYVTGIPLISEDNTLTIIPYKLELLGILERRRELIDEIVDGYLSPENRFLSATKKQEEILNTLSKFHAEGSVRKLFAAQFFERETLPNVVLNELSSPTKDLTIPPTNRDEFITAYCATHLAYCAIKMLLHNSSTSETENDSIQMSDVEKEALYKSLKLVLHTDPYGLIDPEINNHIQRSREVNNFGSAVDSLLSEARERFQKAGVNSTIQLYPDQSNSEIPKCLQVNT